MCVCARAHVCLGGASGFTGQTCDIFRWLAVFRRSYLVSSCVYGLELRGEVSLQI